MSQKPSAYEVHSNCGDIATLVTTVSGHEAWRCRRCRSWWWITLSEVKPTDEGARDDARLACADETDAVAHGFLP